MSIRGLFSDYLPRREQEPLRVTDPRQQLIAPVVQRPTTAPTPRPTPIEFNPNNINLAALNNIDTGSFDLANLGLFAPTPTVAPAPRPAPAPPAPSTTNRFVDPVSAFTPPPAPVVAPTPTPVAPPTPPPVSRIVDPVNVITPPPPAPVAPPAPPVAPVTRIVDPVSAFIPPPTVAPTPTPVAPPTPPADSRYVDPVDFINVSASDLAGLDLSGLNLGDINIPSYEDLNAALTGGSVAPTTLEGLAQLYQQQVSLLQNVDTLEDVDIDDRPYWYNTNVSGVLGQPSQYSGAEFRAATGLPDSFSIYDSGQGLTEENTQRAIALLSESASPLEAVSQYYGIDLQAANNPNSNYNNASKYGTDSGKLSEFQSIVEPILQQVIPYLQLTKGLRYDDALEYAYKNDPMITALYNQYGVDLFRQTDDGSTYFFDPISGTESRTVEVKDSTFRDVGLALSLTAAALILGPVAGEAIASAAGLTTKGAIANTVAATTGALSSAFQGGDFQDILTNALTAGVTGPLQTYIGNTLGVSDAVAAGITAGLLDGVQGGTAKDVITSGFLAGAGEYIRGQQDSGAYWDAEKNALVGPDGTVIGTQASFNNSFNDTPINQLQQAQRNLKNLVDSFNGDVTKAILNYDNPFGLDIGAMSALISAPIDIGDYGLKSDEDEESYTPLTGDTPAGGLEEVVVTGTYNPDYHGYAPAGLSQRGFTVNPLRGNNNDILRYVYVATDANGNETLVVSPDYFANGGDSYGLSEEDLANFLANYQLGNNAYTANGVDVPFPDGFNPFDFSADGTPIGFPSDSSTDTVINKPENLKQLPEPALPSTELPEITIDIPFDPMAPSFDFSVDFQELPQDIQTQVQQIYNDAYREAAGGGGGGGATAADAAAYAANAVNMFLDGQGLSKTAVDELTDPSIFDDTTKSSLDSDGDGLLDDEDPFPLDPLNGKTPVDDTTVDTDNDGVPDSEDDFPNDPLNGGGDADNDGIPDKDDAFPNDPLNGDTDTDGDGMPDSKDSDIDGDGVPNDQDFDPTNPNVTTDPSVDPNAWFKQATDTQLTSASELWSAIQDAIAASDLVAARALLDQYANLTGNETAPPNFSYVPPANRAGGDNGTPPSGGGENGTPPSNGGENGTPPSGGDDNGTPPSGGDDNGTPPSGGGENGTPPSGGGENGTPPSGGGENGTPPSGGGENGTPPIGGGENGTPPSGGGENGTPPSGTPGTTTGGTTTGGADGGTTTGGTGGTGGTGTGTVDGGGDTGTGGGDTTTTGGTGGGTGTGTGTGGGEGDGSGTGTGTGDGEGEGTGSGLGAGVGFGLGLLAGQGGGGMMSPTAASPFMQDLNTQLTQVQLPQQAQAKDYLAELLARLQA